ncbi:MAG: prepilin-type N-terminal cleavage/methylation domain-containing protein [Opitutaceae bacterium]|jgi:prepilin-type N-terminal cleavage/methylation domain-containing protein/prepilin-type processing-associated H-X9-DG protein
MSRLSANCPRDVFGKSKGFTLVELLTTIAIIGILAAILFVGIGRMVTTSRTATCLSNLRQIGLASLQYAADHKNATPGYSWFYPYMEANAATRGTLAPYLNAPARWTDYAPSVLTCPGMQSQFPSNLQGANTYTINGYCTSLTELGDPMPLTTGSGQPRTLRISDSIAPGRQMLFIDGLAQTQNSSTEKWSYLSTAFSSNAATYGRFVHNDMSNAVFLDGHCTSIPHAQLLAYSATATFWTGR